MIEPKYKPGDLFIFDSDKTHFKHGLVEVEYAKTGGQYSEFIRTANRNDWRYGLTSDDFRYLIPVNVYNSKLYKAMK